MRATQVNHSDSPDFAALRAAELEPWLAHIHGNRFADVLAIKGEPGEAELAGQPPFFGADGEALESALDSLGYGSNNWCGLALELPERNSLNAAETRLIIEIIDPMALLTLDSRAMDIIQKCYGNDLLPAIPKPGHKTQLLGRVLVYVDGFETALTSNDDGKAKRRAWKELKALKR